MGIRIDLPEETDVVLPRPKHRAGTLRLLLAVVVLAGSIDGGLYLHANRPSGSYRLVGLAVLAAFHPLLVPLGLLLAPLTTQGPKTLGLGLAAAGLTLLAALCARTYVHRGSRAALLGVLLAGLASYWLAARFLLQAMYKVGWY